MHHDMTKVTKTFWENKNPPSVYSLYKDLFEQYFETKTRPLMEKPCVSDCLECPEFSSLPLNWRTANSVLRGLAIKPFDHVLFVREIVVLRLVTEKLKWRNTCGHCYATGIARDNYALFLSFFSLLCFVILSEPSMQFSDQSKLWACWSNVWHLYTQYCAPREYIGNKPNWL